MKKIFLKLLLISLVINFGVLPTYAVNLTNNTFYNKLIVNGDISVTELSEYTGKSVSMTLKNGKDIIYLGEEVVNANGSYEFIIDIGEHKAENLTFNVRIGNKNAQNTLVSAINKTSMYLNIPVNVKAGDGNAQVIAALDDISKMCGEYTVLAAVYSDGKMKFVKSYNKNSSEILSDGDVILSDVLTDVSEDDTVKLFVWADTEKNLPLAKSSIQVSGDTTFQDGDVVAVVGDSITDEYGYPMQLELFYMTRYPEREITFYNKGINGQGAEKIYNRQDWDILKENPNKVILMYGVNDLWWHYYDTEEGHNKKLNDSYAKTGELVDALISKNVTPVLVTPTMYDERSVVTNGVADCAGTNGWLTKLSDKLKVMAEEKGVQLLDVNRVTNEITYRTENENVQYVITGSDRIHPHPVHGSLLIAYSFLTEQGVDPYVAWVEIDAYKNAKMHNCNITNLEISEDGVSYTYSPKAEPMARNGYDAALTVLPELTERLNKEVIMVAGLDSNRNYNLYLNGVSAGSYTGTDFENGVNIATLSANPNLARANNVYSELAKKRTAEDKLRDIAITESYKGEYSIYSKTGYTEFLNAMSSQMFYGSFAKFWDYAQQVEEIENAMESAWSAAREYAQPVSYEVVISAE